MAPFLLLAAALAAPARACMEIASFRKLFPELDAKPEAPRQAVVLYDRVAARDDAGEAALRYGTGDCVDVLDGPRRGRDRPSYLVARDGGPGAWVDARALYVFPSDRERTYRAFLAGDDVPAAEGDGQDEQRRALASSAFLERAGRSARGRVRGYAFARRVAKAPAARLADLCDAARRDPEPDVLWAAQRALERRLWDLPPPAAAALRRRCPGLADSP